MYFPSYDTQKLQSTASKPKIYYVSSTIES